MGGIRRRLFRFAGAAALAAAALSGCDELGIKAEARAIVEAGNQEPTWIKETLASEGDVGSASSLALYGNEPRIAFYRKDARNIGLYFSKRSGSGWGVSELVHLNTGSVVSLDVNSTDVPFIAAFSSSGSSIGYYAKPDGWEKDTAFLPSIGSVASLSLCADYVNDATNHPPKTGVLLGYGWANGPGSGTVSLHRSGSASDIVSLSNPSGTAPSMVMCAESAAIQHFIYIDKILVPLGAYWNSYPLVSPYRFSGEGDITSISFALDPAGGMHAAYVLGTNTYYRSATTSAPSSWEYPSDPPIVAHATAGLAIGAIPDGSGGYLPCVAYQDGTPKKHLLLSYKTKAGTWLTETVEDGVEVIGDVSLSVDSLGRVHISYYDYDHADMKYARRLPVY